ncbi:hypothetical protein RDn1_180 [Candidatus Termititenax dinenymphae]|uniref:PorV/PorQ family protein n=1 Tax=Candidatus Termititenax dinenymphae TaxID=2218523 RepID=A0A388TKW8_9BACT|nr:hypothetical protein RDn1_180 [Candidatus Termititenax dinenymphae]
MVCQRSNMRKLLVTIFAGVLLTNAVLAAVNGPGTTAANYLKIGLGAKAVALGENFTAGTDDTSSIYWNTAGLSSVKNTRVDFMQLNWLAGISAKTIFGALPLSERDTLGASVLMLDTPQDKETTFAPDGSSTWYETGDKFKSAISVFNLGYSRAISNSFHAGLGIKLINEDLAGDKTDGAALDAGIIYEGLLLPELTLGVSLQNLGLKQLRPDEEFPTQFSLGFNYTTVLFRNILNILTDVKIPNDNEPRFGVGAEYWLGQYFAARFGFNTFSQFSIGLGVAFSSLAADYAYVPMGELGITHRISLGYTFGLPKKSANTAKQSVPEKQKQADVIDLSKDSASDLFTKFDF